MSDIPLSPYETFLQKYNFKRSDSSYKAYVAFVKEEQLVQKEFEIAERLRQEQGIIQTSPQTKSPVTLQ